MHSKPDLPVHDEDDGTWFQPSPAQTAAGFQETPIPGTEASHDTSGAKVPHPKTEAPADHLTDVPTGQFTQAQTGLPTEQGGPGGLNAFPTAEFTGESKEAGSDPGSGSGMGTGSGSRDTSDWDAAPPPVIQKGLVVFGKYHLLDMIGEGGMGQVWKVRHVELDSDRALKLIKPEIAKNADGWKRFRREARVMDRLGQHPNSVAIYDFKRVQSMAYIEMAFVRGQSLDKILKDNDGQPMPLAWILSVLRQLCSVLQEAHSHADETTGRPKPIVHRDLKPSNLMIIDHKPVGQNLKVLDFGIAKMVDDKSAEDERTMELTGASVFLGTAGYASPEQIRGDKELDGRSDLYSTGVILYQFLTGELPFHGNRMAMLAAHMMRAPAPMKETNPKANISPEIEEVVLRCLAKDPDERYQTAAEMYAAFSDAAGEQDEQPDRTSHQKQKLKKPDRKQDKKKEPTRPLWPFAVAALLLIGLVGGGAAFVMTRTKLDEKPPTKQVTTTTDQTGIKEPPVPPTPKKVTKLFLEGYVAVEERGLADDLSPKVLVRKSDSVEFKRLNEVAYIPEKYEPASKDFSGWPEVIVRQPGNARFIRIDAKEYLRGDPRAIKPETPSPDQSEAEITPDPDLKGNPCFPHRVKVSAFYIQETEVTNGEIEDYVKGQKDLKPGEFVRWKESFEALQDTLNRDKKDPAAAYKAARLYPAVCISYTSARAYAQKVGGRLPTEAEWELAAKSGLNDRLWAWEIPAEPDDVKHMAHLSYGSAKTKTDHNPAKIRSYPETDKTEQKVYDMNGNVREWCLDIYKPYGDILTIHPTVDGPLKDDAEAVQKTSGALDPNYVIRGGSFLTDTRDAMIFQRDAEPPDLEKLDIGFRLVISCPEINQAQAKAGGAR